MRGPFIAGILLLVSATTGAQSVGQSSGTADAWAFQRYPVAIDFRGKPAEPLLVTPREHAYRTVIRAAARKGPNFAGHYTLAQWGCGSPCLGFVIIDARSGAIYDPGITVGCADKDGLAAEIDFKPSSRIIAATGVSETAVSSEEAECGTDYYLWDGKQLAHLHFEPWPKSGPQD